MNIVDWLQGHILFHPLAAIELAEEENLPLSSARQAVLLLFFLPPNGGWVCLDREAARRKLAMTPAEVLAATIYLSRSGFIETTYSDDLVWVRLKQEAE